MCLYVLILPNAELKNLISKTEAAPKEHHDQGMTGRGKGHFLRLKVRTQALTMFVFNYLLQKYLMGLGQIQLAYIYIYTYTYSHTECQLFCKVKQDTFLQKPVHKRQLLVFALTILHITFSTKSRHFRVRGRYVLDKVKRLDSYKKKKKKKITISGF